MTMMWTGSSNNKIIGLLILVLLKAETVWSQTTCRKGKIKVPHQKGYFQVDFPNDIEVEALCDGTVTVRDSGEICIDGRVSYDQIAEAVGTPIRAPASRSISVTGHLISGSGNVVLGTEANFLYDFVTRYYIDGVEFPGDSLLADNVFAASRGLITGVCFDKSFTRPEELYAITHDIWLPGSANEDKYTEANVIYASCWSIVAEYQTPTNFGPFFGTITNTLITFVANLTPGFLFKIFPLLGDTGIFRFFVVGSLSTAQFPHPLDAPDVAVEDVQIDTEWSTLMAAMADGLFTVDKVPLYMGALIKKVEPLTDKACWSTTVASIDISAPPGSGNQLDKYVKETVLPALKSRGNVTLHFGKRLDSGSEILETALATYNRQCGVQLDVTPTTCYHPACTRTSTITNFTWPEGLYQPATEKQ